MSIDQQHPTIQFTFHWPFSGIQSGPRGLPRVRLHSEGRNAIACQLLAQPVAEAMWAPTSTNKRVQLQNKAFHAKVVKSNCIPRYAYEGVVATTL